MPPRFDPPVYVRPHPARNKSFLQGTYNARLYPISETSFFQRSPRLRGETGAPSPRETTTMSRASRRNRRHSSVVGFCLRDSTTNWDPARQMHLHLHICPPASLLPPQSRWLFGADGSLPQSWWWLGADGPLPHSWWQVIIGHDPRNHQCSC